mmetsp:Transcript_9726/g.9827  ORF Transcript_9726/g.9827 Transcript_9726/m.9827 type:complete len:110 (-) Transcript_9726:511-840(-)
MMVLKICNLSIPSLSYHTKKRKEHTQHKRIIIYGTSRCGQQLTPGRSPLFSRRLRRTGTAAKPSSSTSGTASISLGAPNCLDGAAGAEDADKANGSGPNNDPAAYVAAS